MKKRAWRRRRTKTRVYWDEGIRTGRAAHAEEGETAEKDGDEEKDEEKEDKEDDEEEEREHVSYRFSAAPVSLQKETQSNEEREDYNDDERTLQKQEKRKERCTSKEAIPKKTSQCSSCTINKEHKNIFSSPSSQEDVAAVEAAGWCAGAGEGGREGTADIDEAIAQSLYSYLAAAVQPLQQLLVRPAATCAPAVHQSLAVTRPKNEDEEQGDVVERHSNHDAHQTIRTMAWMQKTEKRGMPSSNLTKVHTVEEE